MHFEDGECHDKNAISTIWSAVFKYPDSDNTQVVDGTTYLYCIVLSRNLTDHFWAVYPNYNNPKKAKDKLPEYLTLQKLNK